MNSPMRLGVSPTATTHTDFYSQRFWGFLFLCWNPGLWGLSLSPVVPPSLPKYQCGTSQSASHRLAHPVLQLPPCRTSTQPRLPISTLPTSLNKCFFFNSLVVGLPYSSIFWHFWLFLFLNLFLSFFWLHKEAKLSTYFFILVRSLHVEFIKSDLLKEKNLLLSRFLIDLIHFFF